MRATAPVSFLQGTLLGAAYGRPCTDRRPPTSSENPSVGSSSPYPAQAEALAAAHPVERPDRARAGTAAADLAFTSYLRVAAISGVVLIHAMSGLVKADAIRGSLGWWIGTSLSLGVSWAVPVFIIVSGALLLAPRPGEGAREFYARRLRRIAIPLVVAHVGYFAVRAFLLHEHLTVQVVVADLLRANVYVQLYFFWIMLGLYLVTPLLRNALAGRGRRELLAIAAAGIGFMWAVHAGQVALIAVGKPVAIWQPAALALWIPYLGYFVAGYALRNVVLAPRALLAMVGLFIVASAVVVWQYTSGSGLLILAVAGGGYQGLPVATSAVTLFIVARSVIGSRSWFAIGPWAPTVRQLGDLSLGVFIVHLVVMRYAWRLPGLSASSAGQSLPVALELWLVVLLVSFVSSAVLAKIPVLRRTIGM
jgi:surface polysaccharide O-acyltransferase-like enzyme